MDGASPLLALRLAGQDHALEPGREYLLGSAPECDLRLAAGAAAHHARIVVGFDGARLVELGGAGSTWRNGERVDRTPIVIGDVLRFGEVVSATVVRDGGYAAIVPLPHLRAEARERRIRAVRVAAMALRRADGQTLQELIARELRHAPWFALSATLHVLLLLLAWLLLPAQSVVAPQRISVDVQLADRGTDPRDAAVAPPEVQVEPVHAEIDPLPAEPPAASADAAPADVDGASPRASMPAVNGPIRVRAAHSGGGGSGEAAGDLGELGSGSFRRTVGELRKSGLEIVFVFDSTGSMTRMIHDTKTTIGQMLAVLRALVPDARVGLVTYRDRGAEHYLVRQVPLGLDFWRATNFVQFVTADGGGDLPEDVRAGMRAAFAQRWRPGARRVVVLAGDAPPHARDLDELIAEVRSFTRDGRSFVHTLLTSREHLEDDATKAFVAIAAAGHGTCERLEAGDRVLQRVLTLAFGREFDRDLGGVVRAVATDAERVDTRALDLARRGGPALAAALRENPVPQALWNALVKRPRRATVHQLVDLLADRGATEPTRQAVAAALQRIFELPLPPIDPEAGQPPSPRELARLRALADRVAD